MSTAALIQAARPGQPPTWRGEAISTSVPTGEAAKAAEILDRAAEMRGFVIAEVALVTKSGMDVVYARGNVEVQA